LGPTPFAFLVGIVHAAMSAIFGDYLKSLR
jgi:hypothetical protein